MATNSNGTKTYTSTYKGVTTTSVVDSSGRVLSTTKTPSNSSSVSSSLSNSTSKSNSGSNKVTYDKNVDYAAEINKAKQNGASQSYIDQLTAQREAKIKGENLTQYMTPSSSSSSNDSNLAQSHRDKFLTDDGNRNGTAYDPEKDGVIGPYGYGEGSTYGNRETMYEFYNPTTGKWDIFPSNYTNYKDARKARGLDESWQLRRATTYGVAGSRGQSANFGLVGYAGDRGASGGFADNALKTVEAAQQLYNGLAKDAQTQAILQGILNGTISTAGVNFGNMASSGALLNGLTSQGTYDGVNLGDKSTYSNLNNITFNGTGTVGTGDFNTSLSTNGYPEFEYYDPTEEYKQIAEELAEAREAQLAALRKQYQAAADRASDEYDEQGKEAYVNYLLQQKQLPRVMAAQGLGGGATEGSLLRLANNYNSTASDISQQKQNALTDYDLQLLQAQAQADSDIAGYNAEYGQLAIQAAQAAAEAQNAYNMQIAQMQMAQNQFEAEMAYNQAQAARQDYYDNINLLASLGQYDQLSQMGFDTSRLQALSDLEYQQALNSVNGTNNYRTSSSSSRSTGGSSSSGYSALNYEPEFSISQVNSMISDGNVTPAVLDAYEYYNGVPYKAATPEQIRNAYSDPVNGTFVRGVGYISDEGIYQLNKMNKIAEVTDGNGAVYYTYKE